MLAPLAVRLVLLPKQIVGVPAVAVTEGSERAVIGIDWLFTQPLPSVPVTVYVSLVVRVVLTTAPVVAVNPVEGLHA